MRIRHIAAAWLIALAAFAAIWSNHESARAGMMLKGVGANAVIAPASLTYATASTNGSPAEITQAGASTITFTAAPIGVADSTRFVVVAARIGTFGTISSVAVGATTLTVAITSNPSGTVFGIWYGLVTSGTTANIVITSSISDITDAIIEISTLTGSVATSVSDSNDAGYFLHNPSSTATVTVPIGGVAITVVDDATPWNTGQFTNATMQLRTTGTAALFTATNTTAGSQAMVYDGPGLYFGGQVAVAFSP